MPFSQLKEIGLNDFNLNIREKTEKVLKSEVINKKNNPNLLIKLDKPDINQIENKFEAFNLLNTYYEQSNGKNLLTRKNINLNFKNSFIHDCIQNNYLMNK